MIRKTLIVISTALAAATLVLAAFSFLTPLWWDSTPTDCAWLALQVDEGYATVLVLDVAKLRSVLFRNVARRYMGGQKEQRTYTDAASFAAAFRRALPEIRQIYEQAGLRGQLPTMKAVSFHSCRNWSIWGLAVYSPRGNLHRGAIVPLWMPMLVFATCPAIALIRGPVRRWRRLRKGWCVKCGYNLTGNVTGICPECGQPT
ncbi:MAG: hypothetical protein JSV19_04005 [Phycisphaerales bacterium]|nr:MAG: hypothetical protein JSV19_04005 [Phycisphaerales bacterium]